MTPKTAYFADNTELGQDHNKQANLVQCLCQKHSLCHFNPLFLQWTLSKWLFLPVFILDSVATKGAASERVHFVETSWSILDSSIVAICAGDRSSNYPGPLLQLWRLEAPLLGGFSDTSCQKKRQQCTASQVGMAIAKCNCYGS